MYTGIFMALNLLYQVLTSWLIAYCVLRLFYKTVSATNSEIYREPTFLTWILAGADLNLHPTAKFIVSGILNHGIGIFFAGIYYLMWYYEFADISFTTSLMIGLISALLRIVSWTFLLIIIPSSWLINFKGYYLQLVFLHNIFTFIVAILYKLY